MRNRFPGALPVPPEPDADVEVPYTKRYERGFDAGEAVAWLMSRSEWEATIGAECDAVEAERPPFGPAPSYTTRELEAALFYQVMCGIRTWKAARKELAGDTAVRARAALGFDVARETRCAQEVKRLVGVPPESTMCRHRKRFPWDRRLGAYRRYFQSCAGSTRTTLSCARGCASCRATSTKRREGSGAWHGKRHSPRQRVVVV